MKKLLKIVGFSVLGFFVLIIGIAVLIGIFVPEEELEEASARRAKERQEAQLKKEQESQLVKETPPTPVEKVVEKTQPKPKKNETDTSAEEPYFFKELAEREERRQAEWNLPENANLKQLLKTLPVSETLEHVTESWKVYPSSDSVEYARKTLEVRQMLCMGRLQVEDMLLTEHEFGSNAYVRAYDSKVIEVQGRFYRATLDGEIEFEVWDKNKVFVVGVLQCTFPESQYNQIHSMQPSAFVRVKGKLRVTPVSKGAFYKLVYCSFVN